MLSILSLILCKEIKKQTICILISVYLITQGMMGWPWVNMFVPYRSRLSKQTFEPLIQRYFHSAADNKHSCMTAGQINKTFTQIPQKHNGLELKLYIILWTYCENIMVNTIRLICSKSAFRIWISTRCKTKHLFQNLVNCLKFRRNVSKNST